MLLRDVAQLVYQYPVYGDIALDEVLDFVHLAKPCPSCHRDHPRRQAIPSTSAAAANSRVPLRSVRKKLDGGAVVLARV